MNQDFKRLNEIRDSFLFFVKNHQPYFHSRAKNGWRKTELGNMLTVELRDWRDGRFRRARRVRGSFRCRTGRSNKRGGLVAVPLIPAITHGLRAPCIRAPACLRDSRKITFIGIGRKKRQTRSSVTFGDRFNWISALKASAADVGRGRTLVNASRVSRCHVKKKEVEFITINERCNQSQRAKRPG